MGISFEELEDRYVDDRHSYAFPYDPKTLQIADIEWDKILEYPKDILFVAVPFVKTLDPVGWNETEGLKETGVIPWNKSGIDELIAKNRLKQPIKDALQEGTVRVCAVVFCGVLILIRMPPLILIKMPPLICKNNHSLS